MLNYIKSEIYKSTISDSIKKIFLYTGLISIIFLIGYWGLMKLTESDITSAYIFSSYKELVLFSFFLTIIVVISINSNDYNYKVYNNTVAFGISKKDIFFGKYFTEILVGVILWVYLIILNVTITYIFFGIDSSVFGEQIRVIGQASLKLLPLYVTSLTICHCLTFLFKQRVVVFVLMIYGLVFPLSFVSGTGIGFIDKFSTDIIPKIQHWFILLDVDIILSNVKNSHLSLIGIKSDEIINTTLSAPSNSSILGISICYCIIALVLGFYSFQKREVK